MIFPTAHRSIKSMTALVVVAIVGAAALTASAGEKIKFSEPNSPVLTSNMTPAAPSSAANPFNAPSGLKQVQEDLFGPLRNSMSSLEDQSTTIQSPMFRPQTQTLTRHELQLREQRRNWAFTDLNDMYPELSTEQKIGLDDQLSLGQSKKPVSLIQRYYDDKGRPTTAKMSGTGTDFYGVHQSLTNNGLNFLAKAFSQNDSSIKTILAAALISGDTTTPAFGQVQGLGMTYEERHDELAAKKRMDEFRHLLDPSLPPTRQTTSRLVDPFATDLVKPTSPTFTSSGGTSDVNAQARRIMATPLSGTLDPTVASLRSQVTDDPTAVALGLNNTAKKPTPAAVVPPKTFQEMLDPFAAGKAKPRF